MINPPQSSDILTPLDTYLYLSQKVWQLNFFFNVGQLWVQVSVNQQKKL